MPQPPKQNYADDNDKQDSQLPTARPASDRLNGWPLRRIRWHRFCTLPTAGNQNVGYSLEGGLTGTVPCREIREGHQRLAPLRGGMLASLIRIKGAVFNVM